MIKRIIACLCTLAMPLSAQASTELARQWGIEAIRLSVETSSLIHSIDLGAQPDITDLYALDLHRFGRTSAQLARWIDETDGQHDLSCIFRGMATESQDQLIALEQSGDALDQRESLRRLAAMFADAEIIAVAAQHTSPTASRMTANMHASCQADAHSVLQTLR